MDFLITKGQFKQGKKFLQPGDTITLDPKEAKRMDPEGICLKTKDQLDKEAKELADKSKSAHDKAGKLGGGK